MPRRFQFSLAPFLIAVTLSIQGYAQQLNFQRLARTGDAVPDQPDHFFRNISAEEFVDGRILMEGEFDCSDCEGIYLYESGTLRKVADTDTLLPDSEDDFRTFLTIKALSEDYVFFDGTYGFGTGQQFFYAPVGSLILEETLLREISIPGGTGVFGGINGNVSFDKTLSGKTFVFNAEGENEQEGIYKVDITTNVAEKIADRNDSIPGESMGRNFYDFDVVQIEGETILFFAGIYNHPTEDEIQGLYLYENDSLIRVMDQFMTKPGTESTLLGQPRSPRLDNGRVYFTTGQGLFMWNAGTIETIVDRTTEIPGSTENFNSPQLALVSDGTILFSDRPRFGGTTTFYLAKEGGIVAMYSGVPEVDGQQPVSAAQRGIVGTEIIYDVNFGGGDIGVYRLDVSGFVGAIPTPTFTPTPDGPTPTFTPTPTLSPPASPDLTVQINPIPNPDFRMDIPTDLLCGNPGYFRVAVSNIGEGPTTEPIVVTANLTDDLDFVRVVGEVDGWVCTAKEHILTCTRFETLASETPFTTDFEILVAVSEDSQESIVVDVTASTANDNDPSNDSSFVAATVGRPPVEVLIVSPENGDAIATGTEVRLNALIPAAGSSRKVGTYEIIWDGTAEFKGSSRGLFSPAAFELKRRSFKFPRVPKEYSEGAPIRFGVRVIDEFAFFSKVAWVTVFAFPELTPFAVNFIRPAQGTVVEGNETSGVRMEGIAQVSVPAGVRSVTTELDLEDSNDDGSFNLSTLPLILERDGAGRVTELILVMQATVSGEDFGILFPEDGDYEIDFEIQLEDFAGSLTARSRRFTVRKGNPQKQLPVQSTLKGTNNLDDTSRIVDSLVTGSTLERSLVLGATVENSTIRSSILLPGVEASNAEIDFGVVLSGTVSKEGITLTPPALLSDLYENGESGHVLSTVLTGDSNRDGLVEVEDRFGIVNGWYDGAEGFDLNLDEEVDPTDLLNLVEFWKD